MVRQSRNQNNNNNNNNKDLLNFHFATAPPRQETNHHNRNDHYNNNNNRHHYKNNNNHNKKRNQQNYRRSQQDRSSARKKANHAMFYLHSSANHMFCISRRHHKADPNNNSNNNNDGSTGNTHQQQQVYAFVGCDAPVSWENVLLVKHLAPKNLFSHKNVQQQDDIDQGETCPICLDAFVCARITKCGHVFCLPCILRHVQSYTANNPYQHVKCPCCGIPLLVPDLRPVIVMEQFLQPKLQMTWKLTKLHRYKSCPAPYLPLSDAPQHLAPHAAPNMCDDDAMYCRFQYIDPIMYGAHLQHDQVQLQVAQATSPDDMVPFYIMAMEMIMKQQVSAKDAMVLEQEYIDRFQSESGGIYSVQSKLLSSEYQLPLPETLVVVEEEYNGNATTSTTLEDSVTSLEQHRPRGDSIASDPSTTMVAHARPRGDSITSDTSQQQRRARGDSITSEASASVQKQRARGDSIVSEGTTQSGGYESSPMKQQQQRFRGGSIDSEDCAAAHDIVTNEPTSPRCKNNNKRNNNQKSKKNNNNNNHHQSKRPLLTPKASMYLPQDETFQFYQSEDGQLIFLNGFNMNCLLTEFSKSVPLPEEIDSIRTVSQHRRLLPLPDVVEGTIVEMESIHVTPEIRKRMAFLSHIPHYTDVVFVELDLSFLLSPDTRRKYQSELDKRRKRRQQVKQAEKRADRLLKKKEQERINELKSRIQHIDPNDEFFMIQQQQPPNMLEDVVPTGDDFGPAIMRAINNSDTTSNNKNTGNINTSPPNVSFSRVCRDGAAYFPSVASPTAAEAFPVLGAAAAAVAAPQPKIISPASPPAWGKKSVPLPAANTTNTTTTWPSPSKPIAASPVKPNNNNNNAATTNYPGKKRQSKGKKLVLFSTGGHRDTTF